MNFDSLLADFASKKWNSKPFERLAELLKTSPLQAGIFLEAAMTKVPEGGTFFDLTLSFVTPDDFDQLITIALNTLKTRPGSGAAESVIAYASIQFPVLLHPHLSEIFKLAPNKKTYYANWPWRESGELARSDLNKIIDSDASDDLRIKAWKCLLETRSTPLMNDALDVARKLPLPQAEINYFLEVGYESPTRSLYSESLHHIIFPSDYFVRKQPAWSDRSLHPTWNLPGESATCRFGGLLEVRCGRCNGPLHHLITLPSEIVSSDTDVTLATCLSCLGFESPLLAYRHDATGKPVPMDCSNKTPEFPAVALRETLVQLAPTAPRWRWQDWGSSNNRENLSRVGGHPSWIQSAQYPTCPTCSQRMKHRIQLDSDLTSEDGSEWLWGSGGICYGFWCGTCRVSSFLWQCT